MGVEEAAYVMEKQDGNFEIRQYAPQAVAEIVVDGTMEEAGNKAFRPLFEYISGANRSQGKIAMTAPVGQKPQGQNIAMTAPVGQAAMGNQWAVTFAMPTNLTLAALPTPTDERIRLRTVPAQRLAVVRYSGRWTQRNYQKHLDALRAWMNEHGLTPAGEPFWARYNPPFAPWFLRRNEIWIPVAEAPAAQPPPAGHEGENGRGGGI